MRSILDYLDSCGPTVWLLILLASSYLMEIIACCVLVLSDFFRQDCRQ